MALVSAGALAANLSPAFGQPTTAHNLLIAFVSANNNGTTDTTTTNAPGWVKASPVINSGVQFDWNSIWYKRDCGAGETAPVFTITGTTSASASQLAEFDTAQYLDSSGAAAALSVTNAVSDVAAGDLIVALGSSLSYSLTPTVTSMTDSSGTAVTPTILGSNATGAWRYAFVYGIAGAAGGSKDSITFTSVSNAIIVSFSAVARVPQSGGQRQFPPSQTPGPLAARLGPGTPFAQPAGVWATPITTPPSIPIFVQTLQSGRTLPSRTQPRFNNRIIQPIQTPPIVTVIIQQRQQRLAIPKQRITTGMLPGLGLSGIPQAFIYSNKKLQRQPKQQLRTGMLPAPGISLPQLRHRLRQQLARARNVIATGMLPGQAPSPPTPILPLLVTSMPRRGPPRQPRQRLTSGMLPGKGLSGIPELHTRLQAPRLRRRPLDHISTGMLPGLGLSGIPVQQTKLQTPRLRRAPSQRIQTGQRGSLTVPVPVPAVLRHRKVLQRQPQNHINPPPFVPQGPIYQPQPFPARIASTFFRLRRAPSQRITTGFLPGKGLSGLPPASGTRARNARLVPPKPSRILRGEPGSLTRPVPVPVTPRNRQRIRTIQSKLYPPPFVPAGIIYQPQPQPTIHTHTDYRLKKAPSQQIRTGMLPGRGLSGIPVQQTCHKLPKLQRQPKQRLTRGEPGSITRLVPVPITPRNKQRTRNVPQRFVPGIVIPPFTYPSQPFPTIHTSTNYRLVKAPRQRIITGMLPGRGLSGLPPQPVKARQAPAVPRRPSRIQNPIVPTAKLIPATQIRNTYRLTRRRPGTLRTGMLPGRGLSGLPPTGHMRNSPPRTVQRQPAHGTRTGWIAWGIVPSQPGRVTVTNTLVQSVTITDQAVGSVQLQDELAGTVYISDQQRGSVTIVNTLTNRVIVDNEDME